MRKWDKQNYVPTLVLVSHSPFLDFEFVSDFDIRISDFSREALATADVLCLFFRHLERPNMKTVLLGKSTLSVSRLAYGCWRIGGSWEASEVTAGSEASG